MKNVFFVSLLCTFLVCAGCSDKGQHAVRTYDLLNVTEEMDLKFSDLVDEIRIVPLETAENVLIPDSRYLINDKYIITLGEKAIHQFDVKSGKHIRLLAVEGNGPNEFKYINSALIKNGKLFYSYSGKDFISVIDLETGNFLPSLPTTYKYGVNFAGMTDQEEAIYVMNDSLLSETFDFRTQKATSVLDSVRLRKLEASKAFMFSGFMLGGNAFLKDEEGVFLYNSRFSDTLYKKRGKAIEPYAAFIVPNDKATGSSRAFTSGRELLLSIPYMDSYSILCGFRETVTKVSANSISMSIEAGNLYCIDKKTGDARRVKKYIFDPLFITEFPKPGEKTEGEEDGLIDTVFSMWDNYFAGENVYARVMPAHKVKEYIEVSLEDPDFPKEKVAELQLLDSKLTDESNPVVFMGKKR